MRQVDLVRAGALKVKGLVTDAPFQSAGKVAPVRHAEVQRHAAGLIGQLIDADQVQASEQALLLAALEKHSLTRQLSALLAILAIKACAVTQVNARLQAEAVVEAEVAAQRQRRTHSPAAVLALDGAQAHDLTAVVVVVVAEVQGALQIGDIIKGTTPVQPGKKAVAIGLDIGVRAHPEHAARIAEQKAQAGMPKVLLQPRRDALVVQRVGPGSAVLSAPLICTEGLGPGGGPAIAKQQPRYALTVGQLYGPASAPACTAAAPAKAPLAKAAHGMRFGRLTGGVNRDDTGHLARIIARLARKITDDFVRGQTHRLIAITRAAAKIHVAAKASALLLTAASWTGISQSAESLFMWSEERDNKFLPATVLGLSDCATFGD